MSDHCEVCGEVADPEEGHALCVGIIARERDELREQVEQLKSEVGDWQDETIANWQAWQGSINGAQKIADVMGACREERDELREQVARLEMERDEARLNAICERAGKEEAAEEHTRRRAALEKYASHLRPCEWWEAQNCTCGLNAALTPPAADPLPASADSPPRAPSG